MKKLSILALAAVGLFMTACSSSDAVDENGNNPLVDKGVGYFKVNLNLPSVPVVRAWDETTDLQSGGLNAEYTVDNAMLVLFAGDTEATAKVVQVCQLTKSFTDVTVDNPDQVTTKSEEVVTLSAASVAATKLWALAVINGAGIIDADGTTGVKINGTAKTNATLADLRAQITQATTYGENKFINATGHIFMTNAVLSNTKGGSSDPTANPALHVLCEVNKSLIYEKKDDAEAGAPAVDIYVERAVGKVTLNDASTYTVNTGIKIQGGATPTATFEGWALDLTNSRSFIVRCVPEVATGTFAWNYANAKSSAQNHRFIGFAPVDAEYSTASAGYRTYWALDPNYDGTGNHSADLLSATDIDATVVANKTKIGDDHPQYCYENTFDVDHQSYKNTTMAIVKVKFSGGTFYTVGADRKTLYPETEVATLIANALMGQGDFVTYLNDKHATGVTEVVGTDLTIDWSTNAAGAVTVNDVTIRKEVFADATAKSLKNDVSGGAGLLTTVQGQV